MQPSLKRGTAGTAGISEVAVGWQQRTEGVEKKKEQQKGKNFWETRSAGKEDGLSDWGRKQGLNEGTAALTLPTCLPSTNELQLHRLSPPSG